MDGSTMGSRERGSSSAWSKDIVHVSRRATYCAHVTKAERLVV